MNEVEGEFDGPPKEVIARVAEKLAGRGLSFGKERPSEV